MQYLNGTTKLDVTISDKNCIKFLFRILKKSTLNTEESTTEDAAAVFAVR